MKLLKIALAISLLSFFLPVQAQAALATATQWDVQAGVGASTNGGAFNTAAAGTDMSQFANKNAAGCSSCQSATVNISVTNGVTAGTTTVTSATANFSSALVGNDIYITGGTGAVAAARYEVTGVTNATTITVDRSTGLTAGTGTTINIGGTLDLYSTAVASAQIIDGNIVWVKTGTNTVASTVAVTTNIANVTVQGYTTTHGDTTTGTNRPLLTSSTNSVRLFQLASNAGWAFRNLRMSHTAGTRGDCIHATSTTADALVYNVLMTGCQVGINGNFAVDFATPGLNVVNSEIASSISHGIINCDATSVFGSQIHDNGGDGVNICSHAADIVNVFSYNVIYKNGANGIYDITGTAHNNILTSNALVDNTGDGYKQTTRAATLPYSTTLVNNIFYGNGAYGVDVTATTVNQTITDARFANMNNAYGSNVTNARLNLTAGTGDVALGVCDPFVGRTSNNFALSACGKTALQALGFPGAIPNAGTGFLDIGPLQSQASSGASGYAYVQ